MRGRIWLLAGVAIGIAIGAGRLPFFAGAAANLSDTSQRVVGSGGHDLVRWAAHNGSPRRAVEGLAAFVAVLVPGVTAFLLILAARLSLRLRVVVGLLVLLIGVAGYHYLGHSVATGSLVLAVASAALVAAAAIGPLVATPLAAIAALIGYEFLPRLVSGRPSVPHSEVVALHHALISHPGAPVWLEVIVLVVAALPFAAAARLVLR